MTRISGADQVLALLRARLERMQRRRGNAKPGVRDARPAGIERLRQIVSAADAAGEEVEHALLRGILMEEFGGALSNEPKLHDLVAEVRAILQRDEAANTLLKRAAHDLLRPDGS